MLLLAPQQEVLGFGLRTDGNLKTYFESSSTGSIPMDPQQSAFTCCPAGLQARLYLLII